MSEGNISAFSVIQEFKRSKVSSSSSSTIKKNKQKIECKLKWKWTKLSKFEQVNCIEKIYNTNHNNNDNKNKKNNDDNINYNTVNNYFKLIIIHCKHTITTFTFTSVQFCSVLSFSIPITFLFFNSALLCFISTPFLLSFVLLCYSLIR